MTRLHFLAASAALALVVHAADDPELARDIERHQTGARDLSDVQDELAADVQQLTIEQTAPNVIELFREVEDAMDEAAELLYDHETGGETLAAQTHVIEKIYEAAQERQKQQGGGGQASGAMMEMLQRMMGQEPGQEGQGDQPGNQGGEGQTGDSATGNEAVDGSISGKNSEARTVPKGAGQAGKALPREFQPALEAYNRGAAELAR